MKKKNILFQMHAHKHNMSRIKILKWWIGPISIVDYNIVLEMSYAQLTDVLHFWTSEKWPF